MAKGFNSRGMGGMGGMGGGMNMNMMKQVQKMQQEMAKAQEAVESTLFTATVGGGTVKATVSGKKELQEIFIDPEVLSPEEAETVQDMVVSAVNEALRQADEAMEAGMGSVTGGLNLGGFGL